MELRGSKIGVFLCIFEPLLQQCYALPCYTVITQSVSNVYVSHLILYLRCKFHGNIPNDCQDIANLLLGYFNLGHPVYIV